MPVQTPTRSQPFNGYSEKPPHFSRLLRQAWGYGGHILDLTPWVPRWNQNTVSPVCRKMRLNGKVSVNNRKRDGPVSVFGRVDCTLKDPTKCLWHWGPDRRFNIFNPPAHLCDVTYITEISLYVTLSNHSHSLSCARPSTDTGQHFLRLFRETAPFRSSFTTGMGIRRFANEEFQIKFDLC